MPVLFWDASALGKRYAVENGSATVNSLWNSKAEMAATIWGYAEVYAILTRRLNSGKIDNTTFAVQVSALQNEVLTNPAFTLLTIDDAAVLRGLAFIRNYSLNATDAAILSVVLDYHAAVKSRNGLGLGLVSSDARLNRAVSLQGVAAINPEMISPADIPRILNGL